MGLGARFGWSMHHVLTNVVWFMFSLFCFFWFAHIDHIALRMLLLLLFFDGDRGLELLFLGRDGTGQSFLLTTTINSVVRTPSLFILENSTPLRVSVCVSSSFF